MFDLAREINRSWKNSYNIDEAQNVLRELTRILGFVLPDSEGADVEQIAPMVDLLLDIRSELRLAERFDLADKIRHRLDELGIVVKDNAGNTEWAIKS